MIVILLRWGMEFDDQLTQEEIEERFKKAFGREMNLIERKAFFLATPDEYEDARLAASSSGTDRFNPSNLSN